MEKQRIEDESRDHIARKIQLSHKAKNINVAIVQ
jgi:hypothetical protein